MYTIKTMTITMLITLLLCCVSSSPAQVELGLEGLGGRIGLVDQDYLGSTISIGGTARYHFPTGNPRIKPIAGAGLALHMLKASVSGHRAR